MIHKSLNLYSSTFRTLIGSLIKKNYSSKPKPATCNTISLIKNGINKLKLFDEINLKPADLNWNFILDENNFETINSNNKNRNSHGNIQKIYDLNKQIEQVYLKKGDLQPLIEQIYHQATELSNLTHPDVPIGDPDKSKCILKVGTKTETIKPTIDQISKLYGWLKEDQISNYSTQRAYILKNELADLEMALINYTLEYLNKMGFTYVTVPDILHNSIIQACGFPTTGERTQVYKLDYDNEYGKYCLSGTSEMSLAGFLKNKTFTDDQLPLKYCAVSRCFRAEISGSEREGRLYRLHEFTKVEMFVLTKGDQKISQDMLDELKSCQIELFSGLGLHFQVLDMSSQELGQPAFRKYDIEAWMPANQFYGEISSTSNCLDYQSRRLHIKSSSDFVHTLNGTACAIPRMLTCLVESNWDMQNKQVIIPEKLQKFMNNKKVLKIPKDLKKLQPLRYLKQ